MSKEIIGDACAFIPNKTGGKPRYMRVGTAMKDSEKGDISIKIDTLPIPGSGWEGWINIFARNRAAGVAGGTSTKSRPNFDDLDDDIPF